MQGRACFSLKKTTIIYECDFSFDWTTEQSQSMFDVNWSLCCLHIISISGSRTFLLEKDNFRIWLLLRLEGDSIQVRLVWSPPKKSSHRPRSCSCYWGVHVFESVWKGIDIVGTMKISGTDDKPLIQWSRICWTITFILYFRYSLIPNSIFLHSYSCSHFSPDTINATSATSVKSPYDALSSPKIHSSRTPFLMDQIGFHCSTHFYNII